MEVDKQEERLLREAIREWEEGGLLTGEQADWLKGTITPKKERQQLAQYFFIIAISCGLLAFGALFIDEKLLEQLRRTFLLSNWTIALGAFGLAACCLYQTHRRREKLTKAAYEIYLIPCGLLSLIGLVYLCKEIGNGASYSFFLGAAALMLAALSYGFRSAVLWIGFILAAMGWFGAFSTAFSRNNLFLGMNYPVRFTVFGLLVIALSFVQRQIPRIADAYRATYHTGLLIFFTGFWGVSVFGNYGFLDEWARVRQTHVLGYSVAFGLVTAFTLYLGVKNGDEAVRDYSVLFLLLNLYTRYFEYFWDTLNKGLFFLVLAVSFWLVGRWISKEKKKAPAPSQPPPKEEETRG